MTEAEKREPCPICGKKRDEKYRPFCSKRCADVDLSRWFSGVYAIPDPDKPSKPAEPSEDEGGQLDSKERSR